MELSTIQRVTSFGNSLYAKGSVELQNYKSRISSLLLLGKAEEKENENEHVNSRRFSVSQQENMWQKCKQLLLLMIRRFAKGFGITYVVTTSLNLLSALIKAKFNLPKALLLWKKILFDNNVNISAFIGAFLSLFESFMNLVHNLDWGSKNSRSYFGGFTAGAALFLIPSVELRISISVFFLMRALEALGKYGTLLNLLPYVPHSDIILMVASSMQVLWAMMYQRNSVEPGYLKFLDVHGGCSTARYELMQDRFSANSPHLKTVNFERLKLNLAPLTNPNACDLWHPGDSCTRSPFVFIFQALRRAVPLYMPVYLIPLIMFKSHKLVGALVKNDSNYIKETFVNAAKGVGTSSLFLASYCTIAKVFSCMLYAITGRGIGYDGIASGFSGVTLLIEQPSRRQEVALYVAGQAVRSFYFTWEKYLPKFKHGEVFVFACSMAVLMNVYITKSYLMRPGYFSLFRWLFGSSSGFPKEQLERPVYPILEPPTTRRLDVPVYIYTQVDEYNSESEDDLEHDPKSYTIV